VLAGYSLGGNIVLKAAAELGSGGRDTVAAVCGVSPALDLGPCVDELEKGFNRFYEQRFLVGLKEKLKEKQRLFPDLYETSGLHLVRSLREFDDRYTAPCGGYGTAERYYRQASALPVLDRIRVPALIIQARDDPFVPFSSFTSPQLKSGYIELLDPEHGGHAAFIHKQAETPPWLDRFWAENRAVTFCLENL